MEKSEKNTDKSAWAVGGGLMTGLGIGFFFLQQSALIFVGCILAGLGVGLILSAFISSFKKN